MSATAVNPGNTRPHRPSRLEILEKKLDLQTTLGKKRNERALRLITAVSQNQSADHHELESLKEKFEHLERRVSNGTPMNLALSVSGFTPQEVKQILSITDEDELTDGALLTGVLATLEEQKKLIDTLVDNAAETRGIVNEHGERLDKHEVRLNRNATSIMEVAERQVRHEEKVNETIRLTTKTSIWALPVALLAFLVVWLVVWLTGSQLAGNVIQNGKPVGTFQANLHFGWLGFFLGLVAAGLVLVATRGTKVSLKRKAKKETGSNADLKKTPTQPVSVRKDEPAHS